MRNPQIQNAASFIGKGDGTYSYLSALKDVTQIRYFIKITFIESVKSVGACYSLASARYLPYRGNITYHSEI
jgi:hypothetical protein